MKNFINDSTPNNQTLAASFLWKDPVSIKMIKIRQKGIHFQNSLLKISHFEIKHLFEFSNNGKYFAFFLQGLVYLLDCLNQKILQTIDLNLYSFQFPSQIKFSFDSNFLILAIKLRLNDMSLFLYKKQKERFEQFYVFQKNDIIQFEIQTSEQNLYLLYEDTKGIFFYLKQNIEQLSLSGNTYLDGSGDKSIENRNDAQFFPLTQNTFIFTLFVYNTKHWTRSLQACFISNLKFKILTKSKPYSSIQGIFGLLVKYQLHEKKQICSLFNVFQNKLIKKINFISDLVSSGYSSESKITILQKEIIVKILPITKSFCYSAALIILFLHDLGDFRIQ